MKRIEYKGLTVYIEDVNIESPDVADVTLHVDGRMFRFRGVKQPNGRIQVFTVIDGGDGLPASRRHAVSDLAGAILRDRM